MLPEPIPTQNKTKQQDKMNPVSQHLTTHADVADHDVRLLETHGAVQLTEVIVRDIVGAADGPHHGLAGGRTLTPRDAVHADGAFLAGQTRELAARV